MSRRPGIVVKASVPADGGTPPNNYVAGVTVEIRASWPPKATDDQIADALAQAIILAGKQIAERRIQTAVREQFMKDNAGP